MTELIETRYNLSHRKYFKIKKPRLKQIPIQLVLFIITCYMDKFQTKKICKK